MSLDDAVTDMDRRADRLLEKRRWMIARDERVAHSRRGARRVGDDRARR